jgi:hypothetical protein
MSADTLRPIIPKNGTFCQYGLLKRAMIRQPGPFFMRSRSKAWVYCENMKRTHVCTETACVLFHSALEIISE